MFAGWQFFAMNLWNAWLVFLPGIFFSPLVTVPVAPMTTGITKHFTFHIRWISMQTFYNLNSFSASLCVTFLSDGTNTPISMSAGVGCYQWAIV
jgi:hypothetical protein